MKGGLSIKKHERKVENWVFLMDLKFQFHQETFMTNLRKNLFFQGSVKQVQSERGFH